ncbi:MAG: ABC transporter substrate-binding protein, partial [Blautia sp.]|nr:ABC transporter substrate-binding protein [Blautia sp.]
YELSYEQGHMYSPEELEEFFLRVKEGEGEEFYILGGSMLYLELLFHSFCSFDTLGSSYEGGILLCEKTGDEEGALEEGKAKNPGEIETPQVVNLFATKEFLSFAQRMRRWQQMGFFVPGSSTSEEGCNDMVKRGKILGWFFYNVPGEEVENTSTGEREMVFLPMKEAMRTTEVCQDVLWSIPVTCENPGKVLVFLERLYTDEALVNLLQRGIEGVSYVVTEEGERGKQIAPPEGESVLTIPYYTELGLFGNRRLAYTWAPGEADQISKVEKFSESVSLTSPAWGYSFDPEPVQASHLAVKEVVDRYAGLLVTGEVDPETEIPLLLEELEGAGIQEVLAENQRQLDAFLEAAGKR